MPKKGFTKKNWKFTEEEFTKTRNLLDMKLTVKQTAEVTGWSVPTISRTSLARTYQDYVDVTARYLTKSKEKQAAKNVDQAEVEESQGQTVPEAPAETLGEMLTEDEAVKRSVNTLERIAGALERLADAWESSPKKKGLFKN